MKTTVLLREFFLFAAILCLSIGCVPLFNGIQGEFDLQTPDIRQLEQLDNSRLRLVFSEAINAEVSDFSIHSGGSIQSISQPGADTLEVSLENCDEAGEEYFIEGTVTDSSGNSLWFIQPFYGINSNRALLILNEFIVENSSSRYEKVELYVLQAGNLGGISIYNGASSTYKSSLVFTEQDVEQGEYLVVHFRRNPDEEAGEINEYGRVEDGVLQMATSSQAADGARDFWADGDNGLSDTNGAISVYHTPARRSEVMDAVIYSNRNFEEGESYGSFGTSYTWEVVSELQELGAWSYVQAEIQPEDCIRTEDSTSTRSLNRTSVLLNTKSPDDWYIVDTSESSFGQDNSQVYYEP